MKSHRARKNLLSPAQAEAILASIGSRYRRILADRGALDAASRRHGVTANATTKALRVHAERITGRPVSVQGLRRSQLLHEIAAGAKWDALETKYGPSAVKTACADFVREFAPGVVAERLG